MFARLLMQNRAEELEGLPCEKFCEAVKAEGLPCKSGANGNCHLYEYFHSADIFGIGQPTMISFGQRDGRQGEGSLPVSESIRDIAFSIPWFKKDWPEHIETCANVYRKVAENYRELLQSGG